MRQDLSHTGKVYQLSVDSAGRVVLPAETRVRQACRDGQSLVGIEQPDGKLAILTYSELVSDVQAYFHTKIPKGVSLVEELLADRRAEAQRE